MDDFSVIYRVLTTLRAQMDLDEPNPDEISADAYHVSQNRLDSIMAMLSAEGYVTGVPVMCYGNRRQVLVVSPRITLRGLEYLQENSLMLRAYKLAKGVKEVVPFI